MVQPGRRRWIRATLRALAAISLGVIGLEPALRVLGPHNTTLRRLAYNPNETLSFENANDLPALLDRTLLGFQPYTEFAGFVLSSKSLRTPEYSVGPDEGTHRIVLLGDSFTFVSGGVPYEDHWPARLQDLLNQPAAKDGTSAETALETTGATEILNLSYPAVGLRFQKRMWEIEGARLGADQVVLGFFAGNDFTDEQGRAALGKALPGLKEGLVDASVLIRTVRNAWRIRQGVRVGGFNRNQSKTFPDGGYVVPGYARRYDPTRETFAPGAYLDLQATLMQLCANDREEFFSAMLDDIVGTLVALREQVEASGARFLVAVFPAEYQVDPAFAARVAQHQGRALGDYDIDRPIRALREALDARGILTLDLTPDLRAAQSIEPMYQPHDTHWNRAGDAVVADAIARYLRHGQRSGG